MDWNSRGFTLWIAVIVSHGTFTNLNWFIYSGIFDKTWSTISALLRMLETKVLVGTACLTVQILLCTIDLTGICYKKKLPLLYGKWPYAESGNIASIIQLETLSNLFKIINIFNSWLLASKSTCQKCLELWTKC